MNVCFKGQNYELTNAEKKYIRDKIADLDGLIIGEQNNAYVTVQKFQRAVKVEISYSGEHTPFTRIVQVSESFHSSVDSATNKLKNVVRNSLKKHLKTA